MIKKENFKNKFQYKFLIYFLEGLAFFVILYLIFLPFYPELKYKFLKKGNFTVNGSEDFEKIAQETKDQISYLPQEEFNISADRLIIRKIGVNIPIVVSKSSEYGLSKGAWLDPESSRPDKGGNTVITGHRFKYLPPSNLTFYLLNKLESGDIISVLWEDEYYFYRVKETKIVSPEDLSILAQSTESRLTLYTCDPIYSQKNRLVVIAETLNIDDF